MGRENLGPIPLDMPKVPFIPPEKDHDWHPTPLQEPPPSIDPSDDGDGTPPTHPEDQDHPTQEDEMGDNVIVDHSIKRKHDDDDRLWDPMKPDDEM
ncbi:MAG: hypothetical protein NTX72_04240 [Candidatus Uhrbacteria bacterium]|nr:hypothetical protein [Candidatus Uhrbacteria bacterium]